MRNRLGSETQQLNSEKDEALFAGNVLTFEQHDGSIYYLFVSPPKVVEALLELAELQPDETLYDLGAGDGRIVVRAAQRYRVRSIGIESHIGLVEHANRIVHDLELEEYCQILKGDMYELNLQDADVIVFHMGQEDMNDKIRQRFLEKVDAGARIITVNVKVPGLEPKVTISLNEFTNSYTINRYG